ncbi:MAG: hypothetical protein IRZ28_03620 [Steroidobacteraceae bacterium]|jgi:hypothetical protein|nr:hypothetical protein [Steroidobacteraceae bacterium]
MSDSQDLATIRELDKYAHALHQMRPSSDLDARIDAAIAEWAGTRKTRHVLRRPIFWAASAASLLVIAVGVFLLVSRHDTGMEDFNALAVPPTLLPETNVPAVSAGQVSLWPAESAIFRVKASFAPMGTSGAQAQEGERQYWVDVRIANDGTMRIVQVVPADRGRAVPMP